MLRIPLHVLCHCFLFIMLLSCEKTNDPPVEEEFHMEEFFGESPGEEISISVNGNDLVCKKVGDLYIFQEDIVFTQDQVKKANGLKGVGITNAAKLWEFETVYYTIKAGFPNEERIHSAIEHWEEYTDISFIERTSEPNYVEFKESSDGTASKIGMVGGKQWIWVADWASAGNVIHEIGHTIGLYHEHSKPNRDDFILIHPENMIPRYKRNFQLIHKAIYTEGFDFSSIMLYHSLAGSKNNEPTITKHDGSIIQSQRDYLSQSDIEAVKLLYDEFDCLDCVRGQLTDVDLNTYHTVKIGDQWWMAENLATTRYNDGTEIPNVSSNWDWYESSTEAYCWYEDNEESYKESYGALYNYYVVENDNLCPEGWHLPLESDWQELEIFLGMSKSEASESGRRGSTEGGKMKVEGYKYWYEPNTGASNESGFTGLPGGYRYYSDGDFYDLGAAGYWWGHELTEDLEFKPVVRELGSTHSQVARYRPYDASGYSVRCVKD